MPELLTPVVATWLTPFTAYLILLSTRVTRKRITLQTALGDRTRVHSSLPKTPDNTPALSTVNSNDATLTNVLTPLDPRNVDKLTLAVRAHANYVENIPWCFVVAGVAELNGANPTLLNVMLGLLLVGRVAHVELGLKGRNTLGRGRVFGMVTTWSFMGTMSLYAGWLTRANWGF